MEDNSIASIDEDDLQTTANVQELYFARNKISRISCFAFRNLDSLQILDLGWNNLSSVPSAALARVPSLRILTLKNNLIRFV
uniref:U2A'/phosphoprotein 32 family A C-terminal domain-containing protein n=1 Tax=Helobdella robusta TaxID=6412 RepID=T1EHE1_HELRO